MNRPPVLAALLCLVAAAAEPQLPDQLQGWTAAAPSRRYPPAGFYDYMDGGAEVYLAYGARSLLARSYNKAGERPVNAAVFEMGSAAGAYGVFSFERVDASAGIGQDSEYGGGLLRFWHGRYFVFVQAEQESPAARDLAFALGRALLPALGPAGAAPALARALPAEGQRPLSLRFTLGAQFLASMEPRLADNALGLPERAEAALAAYPAEGKGARLLLARYADPESARKGLAAFLSARAPVPWKPGTPVSGEGGWSLVEQHGAVALLVLDAADAAAARRLADRGRIRLQEVQP